MKILLTGATGFIGGAVLAALQRRGHDVLCPGRRAPPLGRFVAFDYAAATTPAHWRALLDGVDAVVNTVGIFRPQRGQRFDALHAAAPKALFDACVQGGVARVLQFSALGAERAVTAYQRSKDAADRHLLALPLEAAVVQPSLVFGAAGSSSQRLLELAVLPLWVLPEGGVQPVQPVHVDDVADAVCALLEGPRSAWPAHGRIAFVGPEPLAFAAYLQALRGALGLAPAPLLALPRWAVELAARFGEHVPGALFDRAAWQMLQQGSTAPVRPLARLLGRAPRPPAQFLLGLPALPLRRAAQLGWLLPLLRLSLAALWLWTAIVSLWLFPHDESYALLVRSGVPAPLQPLALYGAVALDALFGVLTLAWPRRRLWLAQAALILFYSAVIGWCLPEFWLHPYGPLTKNAPILALLALLCALEKR